MSTEWRVKAPETPPANSKQPSSLPGTAIIPQRSPNPPTRQQLQQAISKQERLADSRERIVSARVNLREAREEVRKHRVRAGDAEATFMSELRRFREQRGSAFPADLDAYYHTVQDTRDALGKLEDDYLQAEKSFGASEWQFIEEESDFYKYELPELFSTDPGQDYNHPETLSQDLNSLDASQTAAREATRNLPKEYQSAVARVEELKGQFKDLRQERVGHLDEHLRLQADCQIPPESQDILEQLIIAKVKVQQLRQEAIINESSISMHGRRASEPWNGPVTSLPKLEFSYGKRAHTESALDCVLDNFSHARKRINQWILDALLDSSLEKARYKAEFPNLDSTASDDRSWWKLLTRYWNDDQSDSRTSDAQTQSLTASRINNKAIGSAAPFSDERVEGDAKYTLREGYAQGPNMISIDAPLPIFLEVVEPPALNLERPLEEFNRVIPPDPRNEVAGHDETLTDLPRVTIHGTDVPASLVEESATTLKAGLDPNQELVVKQKLLHDSAPSLDVYQYCRWHNHEIRLCPIFQVNLDELPIEIQSHPSERRPQSCPENVDHPKRQISKAPRCPGIGSSTSEKPHRRCSSDVYDQFQSVSRSKLFQRIAPKIGVCVVGSHWPPSSIIPDVNDSNRPRGPPLSTAYFRDRSQDSINSPKQLPPEGPEIPKEGQSPKHKAK
ncbi:hypothetical protein K432DRAFT_405125 [Lepidopterella palustris CBS 459.81]|uniref:Uncharacterized protein n=1 Tax=Lepidopterella palustris CBS 459.81 TaxID=1314670 RepID=A0A8E2E9N2_9PEZI|nr:hypothetical protein K432DRAFT_405125 [Lepidopterella palustris CBS 459.81]